MATILVTRPEKDADRIAARLRADGHEVIASPVLRIAEIDAATPAGPFAAILATSANAATWLARPENLAALGATPVFAVGDHAADAIREAGHSDVRSAKGDGKDLVALVGDAIAIPASLLFLVGRQHHEEPIAALRADGYDVTPLVVYQAEAADQLSAEAIAGLRYDVIDAVLHYSPRSARQFFSLAESADAGDKLARLKHVCLSRDVADGLPDSLRGDAIVAERPNDDSLMQALGLAVGGADAEDSGARAKRSSRTRAARVEESARAGDSDADGSGAEQPDASEIVTPDAVVAPQENMMAADAARPPEAESSSLASAAEKTVAPAVASAAPSEAPTSASSSFAPRSDEKPREGREGDEAKEQRAPSILLPLIVAAIAGAVAGAVMALLVAPRPDLSPIEQRIAATAPRSELVSVQQKLDATATALERERNALRAEIAALSTRAASPPPASTTTPAAAPDIAPALQALAQRVAALESKSNDLARLAAQNAAAAEGAAAIRRQALSVAAQSALARSDNYAAALDGLKSLDAPAAQIAALQPFANGGAPTARALADSFRPLAPQLVASSQNLAPDSSVTARAMAALKGLVSVRPVGEARGADVASIVARIEAALARGSFADAATAYATLPEPQRALAATWGASLTQRAAAATAAQSLADDAARSLAAPPK